jgi:ribosomal protein S4E
MITKTGKGYKVVSEKGKNLSSPDLSKEAAKKRLQQIEYFKHRVKSSVKK